MPQFFGNIDNRCRRLREGSRTAASSTTATAGLGVAKWLVIIPPDTLSCPSAKFLAHEGAGGQPRCHGKEHKQAIQTGTKLTARLKSASRSPGAGRRHVCLFNLFLKGCNRESTCNLANVKRWRERGGELPKKSTVPSHSTRQGQQNPIPQTVRRPQVRSHHTDGWNTQRSEKIGVRSAPSIVMLPILNTRSRSAVRSDATCETRHDAGGRVKAAEMREGHLAWVKVESASKAKVCGSTTPVRGQSKRSKQRRESWTVSCCQDGHPRHRAAGSLQ